MQKVTIDVEHARALSGMTLVGERIPLGTPGDYKPCVAKLPGGELLLVSFWQGMLSREKIREEILLFRSKDDGQTWSLPENLTTAKGLLGREPYLTVLADGTVLMTVHFLSNDVRNATGGTVSYLHRTEDGGATWRTTPIVLEGPNESDPGVTSRNVLEMQDSSLILGVSGKGPNADFIWRSYDRGATWPEKYPAEIMGLDPAYPGSFLGEGVWWQSSSGKVYLIQRVDYQYAAKFGVAVPVTEGHFDQYDCMILYETTDEGRTLTPIRAIGGAGQMYPSLLKLTDGRLLLTFTVRSLKRPLGVRAILGEELEDDLRLDMEHDRFLLDTQTAPNVGSGGGFGPTVQLNDGTLVTSYSWRDAEQVTHVEVIRWTGAVAGGEPARS